MDNSLEIRFKMFILKVCSISTKPFLDSSSVLFALSSFPSDLSTTSVSITRKLFLIGFLLFPSFSNAQIILNEVMYDLSGTDTGHEWVEIFNNGTSSVDITTLKFTEATTNHSLKVINGNPVLGPGEYAVLADDVTKFMADWPAFNGNLFDSTFSLNNTGATLMLKEAAGTILDQVTYSSTQGASGDGNSLQLNSGDWIAAAPTPGGVNSTAAADPNPAATVPEQNSTTTPNSKNNSTTVLSSHYSYIPTSDYKAPTKFSITAGRDRLAMVGNPLKFRVEANMYDKRALYYWTFGDGSQGQGKDVEHVFEYPGDYIVVVNGWSEEGESVSRAKVHVVGATFRLEEANEKYIKIKNDSKDEVNLFGWKIVYRNNTFIFPKDSIILPGMTGTFPGEVTGLRPYNIAEVSLKPLSDAVAVSISAPQINQVPATILPLELENPEEIIPPPRATSSEQKRPTIDAAAVITSFISTSTEIVQPKKTQGWWHTILAFFGF